ncbi:MAG: hypothetical protein ACE5K4_03030 [Candidatus Hydrothermarchaeota archaeon]
MEAGVRVGITIVIGVVVLAFVIYVIRTLGAETVEVGKEALRNASFVIGK